MGGRGRISRHGHRGQTTIEFAFTFILVLLCLMGAVGAGFWAEESMAAVTSSETGARLAVGAVNVESSGGQANLPDVAAVCSHSGEVYQTLSTGMLGTKIATSGSGAGCILGVSGADPCTNYSSGSSAPATATVYVCAFYEADPNTTLLATPSYLVVVQISGCMSVMVPTIFSFGGCKSGVPVFDVASLHALTFQE